MSEIITPPFSWKPHAELSATDLSAACTADGHRLISIKTYVKKGKRLYAAIAVKNEGPDWNWTEKMKPDVLRNKMNEEGMRLISLDCFQEGKDIWCTAVWLKNVKKIPWNWTHNKSPGQIKTLFEKETGKLICLRTYLAALQPTQPESLSQTYCAIWIKDDGKPWNWTGDKTMDQLGDALDDEKGFLVSLDNLDPTTWLGDSEHMCAIWYQNDTGRTWFWNNGLNLADLKKEFPKFCSYGMDVVRSGPANFASIMFQYPPPKAAQGAHLLDSTGQGEFGGYENGFGESVKYGMTLTNVSGEEVALKRGMLLHASEGGFSWYVVEEASTYGTVLGMPLALPAGFNQTNWPYQRGAAPPVSRSVLFTYATTASGKFQWLITQMLAHQSGLQPVTPIHAAAPVYIGIIELLEAVVYANGKVQVPVVGMIVNPTGQKITVERLYMKLKDNKGKTLFKGNLPLSFQIDTDVNGTALKPIITGDSMNGSDAPNGKFVKQIEVPRTFEGGTLRIELNIKMGDLCFGDSRFIQFGIAPVNNLQPPIKGVWNWGNGSNSDSLNAHSWPEHRYSFDLAIKDDNNSFLKPGGNHTVNADFYCYGKPVYAMLEGDVYYVDVSNPENSGDLQDVLGPANIVIIQSGDKYHAYAHLRPNSNSLVVGDHVLKGAQIGECGNAGGSSMPHLHFGFATLDATGYLRPLPMRFTSLKTKGGTIADRTPANETEYDAQW